MKISPLLLALLLAISNLHAQDRKKINFDDNWLFHFGHAADPQKDFQYGVAAIFSKSGKTDNTALGTRFNDSNWRKLSLPHDWAVELPFVYSANFDVQSHGYKPVGGLYPETSIGWYRKHFSLPSKDSGRRYQLGFDGVFRDAQFWINGFYLGNNKSGYIGAHYDITDYLRFGSDNVVTVRVDASQYEGWYYEGAGIYRHVWLESFSNTHLDEENVFIRSQINGSKAKLLVTAGIRNDGFQSQGGTVYAYLADRSGRKIARTNAVSFQLAGGKSTEAELVLQINNPKLWNLDDPYLYRVITIIERDGKVIDSIKQRFGFRSFGWSGKEGFFLNGKHVKLLGTNNHPDHAGLGTALPDYLHYYRVRLLKEMGSNTYRTSHGAPSPELLDACDSLGMLVLDEQRLLNSSPEYMDQLERLVKRDRNHPSVFIWSIGNEEGWIQANDVGRRIAQTMMQRLKQLDPTRTITYAADLPNVFHGVNEVIPVRGFNYRQFAVGDYHRAHPSQPIIGTEMGSTVTTRGIYEKDTVRAYVPDQDITAPWWASTAETWWKLAADSAFWAGGFIWTGFDYRGEPTPYKWPNISSHFGVMDVCGFPKNIYYYYQSWWTDKDVLHISPHWNLPAGEAGRKGKEGQPVEVWVNSNADSVTLLLNGKSLGTKTMPRNSHLKWTVGYEPGKLEAIGYKKGRKIFASQETTGAPAEVVVTPYKTTMLADGSDATVLNISVIDRKGRVVPDANNLIRFSVRGDGKIIGVGNGDPSSHEQDRYNDTVAQRRLFNGHAQVIVQSGRTPSTIQFFAQSEGLWQGSTDINTIPAVQANTAKATVQTNFKRTGKMLGADISFLPELEAKGVQFSDKGVKKDAIAILKDHGINYIRLRLFHSPARDSGYSPGKGFCDLDHTLAMARRLKAAGLPWLLDFHYSDYWADPGKQYKPAAWKDLSFSLLKDSMYQYTRRVMQALKSQGTLPQMVQVGNEINHGIIWPEGHVNHLDSLAQLLKAGTAAVLDVAPQTVMMLHIALGGQNDESRFFIDNMIARGVYFDVIGQSYYPKWHGTLSDLRNNMTDLAQRYGRDVILVEYSQLKKEVADITFNLPGGRGKGTFIWEPLNTWEQVFDKDGKANQYLEIYDLLKREYLK